MSIYVIGDLQGCFDAFKCLYSKLEIDPKRDQIWLAGDIVNRGPKSLETLRFVKENRKHIKLVLGNHDLHLLAIYYGVVAVKRKDTLQQILDAPDCDELMNWLRRQPLLIHNESYNAVLTHAGIPHIWSLIKAVKLAGEVESTLAADDPSEYFNAMYGNSPDTWAKGLSGMDRLRVITNYFTRMRFVTDKGQLDFAAKEDPQNAPLGFAPWYSYERSDSVRIFFGHWAALMGKTGKKEFVGVDTGCVWGNYLTAVNLETGEKTTCDCGAQ